MPIDQTTGAQPIPVRPAPPEDERFTGCLLAAACGDALSASSADGEDASTLSPLRYTDHTVLALALADHLPPATTLPTRAWTRTGSRTT